MTEFAVSPESLMHTLNERLASFGARLFLARDAMVTVEVPAEHYAAAMRTLHEDPACAFEQLVNRCRSSRVKSRRASSAKTTTEA
jgi:NADH-quinone oxidoreductase subunit C